MITIVSQKYRDLSVEVEFGELSYNFFKTTVSNLGYFLKKYRDLLQTFHCDCFSKILRIFYASRKS
jgi:hypothetical protein